MQMNNTTVKNCPKSYSEASQRNGKQAVEISILKRREKHRHTWRHVHWISIKELEMFEKSNKYRYTNGEIQVKNKY